MFKRLRRSWSSLKRGRPGSRFRQQYDRQRKEQKSGIGRALRIIAGVVTLPVGLFFLPAPGPGFIIVALGALLLAREFKVAATVLDWIEVRGRHSWAWLKGGWRRLNTARRAAGR